jgi:hypothetical protein
MLSCSPAPKQQQAQAARKQGKFFNDGIKEDGDGVYIYFGNFFFYHFRQPSD